MDVGVLARLELDVLSAAESHRKRTRDGRVRTALAISTDNCGRRRLLLLLNVAVRI